MSLLAFHGVAGARGGRTLFADIDVALDGGGALLVTGPNGAGKSSLLRIAAGLLTPAAGRVDRHARAALLGEGTALDPELPLLAALAFWEPRARCRDALAALGIAALADVPVRLLSTGQRRRAAMARVAASSAPLWLLDEPANGLDAGATALLEAVVARHRRGGGAAVVATHLPIALPGAATLALA